ncbi:MAG: 50S ribosomal protein L19e [Acidilobaceae archaeon]|nr:50S ribosomal protein L19e [Acidilobaceae archaeon]MCX8165742.1 50S ribosomal protein L19e [Acidilobaceae archaeon]MDW7974167.1 50S ribosomal protein L19e [Sulfolobales archaeon]
MVDYRMQRRLAAELLGVGESRIWINPDPKLEEEISQAVTRRDVEKLIHKGIIRVEPVKGNSHTRWLERRRARQEGKRRGYGKREGTARARQDEKELWMGRIRKIRRMLRWLRDHNMIDRRTYRRFYIKAKGGAFKSAYDLKLALQQQGLLKGERSG